MRNGQRHNRLQRPAYLTRTVLARGRAVVVALCLDVDVRARRAFICVGQWHNNEHDQMQHQH